MTRYDKYKKKQTNIEGAIIWKAKTVVLFWK